MSLIWNFLLPITSLSRYNILVLCVASLWPIHTLVRIIEWELMIFKVVATLKRPSCFILLALPDRVLIANFQTSTALLVMFSVRLQNIRRALSTGDAIVARETDLDEEDDQPGDDGSTGGGGAGRRLFSRDIVVSEEVDELAELADDDMRLAEDEDEDEDKEDEEGDEDDARTKTSRACTVLENDEDL